MRLPNDALTGYMLGEPAGDGPEEYAHERQCEKQQHIGRAQRVRGNGGNDIGAVLKDQHQVHSVDAEGAHKRDAMYDDRCIHVRGPLAFTLRPNV